VSIPNIYIIFFLAGQFSLAKDRNDIYIYPNSSVFSFPIVFNRSIVTIVGKIHSILFFMIFWAT